MVSKRLVVKKTYSRDLPHQVQDVHMNEQAGAPVTVLSIFRNHKKSLLVIVAAVVIVFAQAVSFDFVTYDDYDLVSRNGEFLGSLKNVLTSFTTHAFSTSRSAGAYYRPLVLTSFIIEYHIWNLNPLGFHLTNILLHCANVILCYVLLLVFIKNDIMALLGSLLFALHPVQVQAVAWIAGRHDVLMGFFSLLSVVSYVLYRHCSGGGRGYFIMSMISFALALFAKESAIVVLLLLPLIDLILGEVGGSWKKILTQGIRRDLFVAFSVAGAYLIVRLIVFGELFGGERVYGKSSLIERLSVAPALISENCSFVVAPIHLSVVHPVALLAWMQEPWRAVSVFITILLVALVFWAWKRDKVLGFGFLWFTVGLLPALNIVPMAVPVLENRLYLPIVGAVLAVVRGFQLSTTSFRMRFVAGVLAVLVSVCAVASFLRLPVWQNSVTMWSDAINKEPDDPQPYFDLAGYYYEGGAFDMTIELLKKYIGLQPGNILAYSKLRDTYFASRQYNEAATVCRTIIALEPKNPTRYLEAGLLYARMHDLDTALDLYRRGLGIDSGSYQLQYNIGLVYDELARIEDAIYYYRRATELNPRYPQAYFALGNLYARLESNENAIIAIENGMKVGKPPAEIANLLVALYAKTGRIVEARQAADRFGIRYAE